MNTESPLESTSTFINDDAINIEDIEENLFNYFHKSRGVNKSFFTPEFFDNISETIKDLSIFKNKEYDVTISFKKTKVSVEYPMKGNSYITETLTRFVPKINVYSKTMPWKYLSINLDLFYNPTKKSQHHYRNKINAIVFSILTKLAYFDEGKDSYDIYLFDKLCDRVNIEVVTKLSVFLLFPFKTRKTWATSKFFS